MIKTGVGTIKLFKFCFVFGHLLLLFGGFGLIFVLEAVEDLVAFTPIDTKDASLTALYGAGELVIAPMRLFVENPLGYLGALLTIYIFICAVTLAFNYVVRRWGKAIKDMIPSFSLRQWLRERC